MLFSFLFKIKNSSILLLNLNKKNVLNCEDIIFDKLFVSHGGLNLGHLNSAKKNQFARTNFFSLKSYEQM